jgi:hypothetical protein
MTDWLLKCFEPYLKHGLLIDSNLLLLYCVGKHRIDLVPQFKRTKQYTTDDFALVSQIWVRFQKIYTTPTILAEVSNLARQVRESDCEPLMRTLVDVIPLMEEQHKPSSSLTANPSFVKFGLTDSSIAEIAQRKIVVLTDDFPLSQYLNKQKLVAFQFSHFRTL